MSDVVEMVTCDCHGAQSATFVCGHLANSLRSDVPVGFNAAADMDDERPDAWCDACEDRRIEEGGDWTDASDDYREVEVLCALCYDRCRALNEVNSGNHHP